MKMAKIFKTLDSILGKFEKIVAIKNKKLKNIQELEIKAEKIIKEHKENEERRIAEEEEKYFLNTRQEEELNQDEEKNPLPDGAGNEVQAQTKSGIQNHLGQVQADDDNQKNSLNHPALDNLKENHKHPSSLELMRSKLKYWIMPARPPDNC